jgi:hypothetical protein
MILLHLLGHSHFPNDVRGEAIVMPGDAKHSDSRGLRAQGTRRDCQNYGKRSSNDLELANITDGWQKLPN